MRASFALVRSWVSSRDFDSPSTLSFTSPTCCRTIFLVAHALVPPRANAEIAIAPIILFIAVSPLETLAAGPPPRGVSAARVHGQIPVGCLHSQPPEALVRGGGKGEH